MRQVRHLMRSPNESSSHGCLKRISTSALLHDSSFLTVSSGRWATCIAS
ncbi:hypothetical protein KSS87_003735 [Heliosperma pusillum]|nr:hypothetical protein KSS87_003735 [Heliosperma pusillum]